LLCPRQDCRIEPSGAFAGERLNLSVYPGKLVPRPLQIVLDGVRKAGEILVWRGDLLDHEFDFIASSRMRLRSYSISVTLVIIAQMSDPIGIRP
jgi:hypothetical protein